MNTIKEKEMELSTMLKISYKAFSENANSCLELLATYLKQARRNELTLTYDHDRKCFLLYASGSDDTYVTASSSMELKTGITEEIYRLLKKRKNAGKLL